MRSIRNSTAEPEAVSRSSSCAASTPVAHLSRADSHRTMSPTLRHCYPTESIARAELNRRPGSRITPSSGALLQMQNVPDSRGHFGQFGGKYVAETLMPALFELESAYKSARRDPKFRDEIER